MPMAFARAFHQAGAKGYFLEDSTQETPVYFSFRSSMDSFKATSAHGVF